MQVHQGFLTAFDSVADTVISTVASELKAHPTYTLISTGHSLGAALASLGGISLASNFPGQPLLVYTFGQPRTGNPAYADLAEKLIGVNNIFRSTLPVVFMMEIILMLHTPIQPLKHLVSDFTVFRLLRPDY